ncbi:cardiolipin synthase [Irregularibacter muris]|uniref:Cardiolipin synthase n=1 Tax=Irregularibacter muris TaxID=1796619 RepID=A0AAE3KZQ5_9FIRM|nr:cardiolipin synthase [Irregularibacter muris]MCR1898996.1 cardiolipin synthase [Irregularibacter muris]
MIFNGPFSDYSNEIQTVYLNSIGILGGIFEKISSGKLLFGAIISVVFLMTIVLIGVVIFLENRSPSTTAAWLLLLILLPIVGFLFYIYFGQNFKKKKLFNKKEPIDERNLDIMVERQFEKVQDSNVFYDEDIYEKKKLISLLLQNSKSPFTLNNQSEVLTNGRETFKAIFKAIHSAKEHIHVEYYILKDDKIGNILRKLLILKAHQGVEIRLIYDGLGSRNLSKYYINSLKEAGVKVAPFLPVKIPLLNSKLNYRNHRKIVVVDGKIGFIGGLNVGDEYWVGSPKLGFWRDTHFQMKGEAVYLLQYIFLMDWYFSSDSKITQYQRYFPEHREYGKELIQIAVSGPDSPWETIQQAYFTSIATAQEKIYITSPYFVPDESLLMALKTSALSGVDVRIILPDKPDHHTVFWASRSYIEDLLSAGVRVYLYKKGFVHAKILLVDGIIASVGTANMDIRSFQLNFEINALIYNKHTVERLEIDFYEDLGDSEQLFLEEFKKRPISHKIKESFARLFSPIL